MPAATCEHLKAITTVKHAERRECSECMKIGARWVHLRICIACGKVGCCDSSPERHATRHFHREGHPVIQSGEAGEDWRWCFVHHLTG